MGYYGRGVLAESDKLARVHGHFRHARGDFGEESDDRRVAAADFAIKGLRL